MANDQVTREFQERIIRNAHAFVQDAAFPRQLIINIRNRLGHLENAWDRFNETNVVLTQNAIAADDQQQAQQNRNLFDELETLFLEAQATMRERMNIAEQNDNDNQSEEDDQSRHSGEVLEDEDDEQLRNHHHPPDAEPIQPRPRDNPVETQFGLLIERMCQGLANKKENTWGTYDGDLSKWQGFHDNFVAAVHNDQLITPSTKLQLLQSSLQGDALIKFGQWPAGDNNYVEAWEWLKQQNQREYQTSKEILWHLVEFKRIERASGFWIEKLCTAAEGVVRQLRAMKYPVEHYDLFLVHTIHSKLDAETSKDWEIQRKNERPAFKEMIAFLQSRGRALSCRQSFEKKTPYDNRKRQSNDNRFDSKRFKPNGSDGNKSFTKPSGSAETTSCKICKSDHRTYTCPQISSGDTKTRRTKVREHNLCYNCLSPLHTVRDCQVKSNCRNCNGRHHTLLCNNNTPAKKAVNTVQKSNSKSNKKKNASKIEKA